MAVLGVWGLARDSAMGNDEVATRWAALLSLRELAHLLNTVDAVHGFYYLLMHGWMAVGTSPEVMRIPSVIAMTAAVAMTAILARRLTGSGWAALFAGLIMALTPTITYYAQTARSYALVVACVVASTLVLLHALSAETSGAAGARAARRWVAYGALITLGGYLNEMSLLVLAAHGVTVLLARYGRRVVRHWLVAGAVGAALVLPLVVVSTREQAAVAWISAPNLTDFRILFQDYFGATYLIDVILLACAVVAVLPPAAWWERRRASAAAKTAEALPGAASGGAPVSGDASVPRSASVFGAGAASGAAAPGAPASGPAVSGAAASGAGAEAELPWWRRGGVSLPSVAAPLLVLPAALLIGESFILTPLYVDRYVLYGEVGAALLAGGGMYRIGQWLVDAVARQKPGAAAGRQKPGGAAGQRKPGGAAGQRSLLWLPGVVVVALTLLLQLGPQQRVRTPDSRAYNFGGPSRLVGASARPGDGVLFFGPFFRKARLGYPQDFTKTSDFAMAESPRQAGNFQGTDKPFRLVEPLMLARQRIWVIGRQPSPDLATSAFRAESILLRTNFSLILKRQFRGMIVTLWARH
jgi:mannosyltransferase